MKVVITGGGGFLGQVLARKILNARELRSGSSKQMVEEVVLADILRPDEFLFDSLSLGESLGSLRFEVGDVSDPEYCKSIIGSPKESGDDGLSVFHLGAVMSGAPPDLAIRVNLHGTINMLEATRAWQEKAASSTRPTFVFSSAGATLGAGHPADWVSHDDVISDATRAAPHTTYGTTKACAELLLADYSRRGFLDGRGVRLPSVVVRAGAPNAATTSCFSSAVREPLGGTDAAVPVGPDVFHAVTGYRAAIDGIVAVHDAAPGEVDRLLGFDRTVFLPTRSVSLRQLEEATRGVVSPGSLSKLGRVVYEEDERLSAIVGSFPTRVDSGRALALGAPPVPEVEDLIREYCEDFGSALAEGVALKAGDADDGAGPSTLKTGVNRVVALITGGGSGIGRAVAVKLAKGGWGGADGRGNGPDGKRLLVSLVLAGRRAAPLEETMEMCEVACPESSHDVLCVPTDVTKEADVQDLMDTIVKNFGRIDLLFNNAGINIAPTSVESIESEGFERVMDTNVTACWRVAKGAMLVMGKQEPRGGRVVNNGSISSSSPRPGSAPYTASKHAVLGLTKSIALDGRALDVACGQIDFGNVSSDMTNAVGGSSYSMSSGMPQANGTVMPEPTFSVEDAANAVHAMAALPPSANVLNMTVMASQMPFVGRG